MSLFPLSDEEWRERSKRLASLIQEYRRVELNKKTITKELTKQLKELREEIDKLSDVVVYGKELRPIGLGGEDDTWDR